MHTLAHASHHLPLRDALADQAWQGALEDKRENVRSGQAGQEALKGSGALEDRKRGDSRHRSRAGRERNAAKRMFKEAR